MMELFSICEFLFSGNDLFNNIGGIPMQTGTVNMGRSRKTVEEVELLAGKVPVFTAGITLKEA